MARTGRALLSLAVLTHYCTAQQPDGLSLYESRVNARADGPCDDSDKDQKCGLALQGGRLSFAWSTPLLKFDLKEVEDDIASFNKAIHDVLLQEWDSFVEGCKSTPGKCGKPGHPEALYNYFFTHQMTGQRGYTKLGTGIKSLRELPEYRRLVRYLQQGLDEYLLAAGHPEQTLEMRSRDLQLWANVQPRGVHHASHYHTDCTVSGTYYVDVPENSGRLVLEDPRGRLSPFDKDITHKPEGGHLLMWPPWLRHHVTPNLNTTHPRMALSWNYAGKCGNNQQCWSRTNNVAAIFPSGSLRTGSSTNMGSRISTREPPQRQHGYA